MPREDVSPDEQLAALQRVQARETSEPRRPIRGARSGESSQGSSSPMWIDGLSSAETSWPRRSETSSKASGSGGIERRGGALDPEHPLETVRHDREWPVAVVA